jgi:intracellular sulfur oxidation DsrE/DsrF family protein
VNSAKFAEQQKALDELMNKGATVFVCPMCMNHYDIREADLLPGMKVGNPQLTGDALFMDNTRALTW